MKYVEHIERESGVAMTAEGGVLTPAQTCAFSYDGDMIACGLTSGWFVVFR